MGAIFDDELKRLRSHFMEMGIDASEQIYQATKAFTDHDADLADKVLTTDTKINDEEIHLEKQALKLMALQNPVATDFRKIISILKATNDLERIGENANSIAWETIRVKGNPRIPEVEAIIKSMSKKVNFMLDQVLKAYVQGDEKLAREVAKKDDEVDEDYVKARKLIISGIKQDPEAAVASSSYFMVIRLLERIGDHVVNLAQWVIYKMSGELVDLNTKDTDEMTEL